MKKKNNTPKFFTEEWYPLNIIILVFCILLIAVLIWGGVTNWKFIPKKTQIPTPRPPTPPTPQNSGSRHGWLVELPRPAQLGAPGGRRGDGGALGDDAGAPHGAAHEQLVRLGR